MSDRTRQVPDDRRSGDGRNIDRSLGTLGGEAAQQTAPGAIPFEVYDRTPADPARARDAPTYFGRPVIKEPVWIWSVPLYFYAGGAAGAAAVLGAAVQLFGDGGSRKLVERCRLIAFAGSASGAGLLVYDLGRPERFMNMLRVFRPTSAMSMGSWILASSGSLNAAAAVSARSNGPLRRLGDAGGLAAGVTGLALAGYTGVLLSDTSVPVWQATRRSLPFLFTASAMSSAAALLEMSDLDEDEHRIVRRLGIAGMVGELVATAWMEREASRVERVGRPLREGPSGALWTAAKALTASALAATVVPGTGRLKRIASGLLGTAGALALRWAIFHAGKASARDPRATFDQQRAGAGAAEVTGRAAVTSASGRATDAGLGSP